MLRQQLPVLACQRFAVGKCQPFMRPQKPQAA